MVGKNCRGPSERLLSMSSPLANATDRIPLSAPTGEVLLTIRDGDLLNSPPARLGKLPADSVSLARRGVAGLRSGCVNSNLAESLLLTPSN